MIFIVMAEREPIAPPNVFPKMSLSSAVPSEVMYCALSIATVNKNENKIAFFTPKNRHTPAPNGTKSHTLSTTPILEEAFLKNVPTYEKSSIFVFSHAVSRNIIVSYKMKTTYAPVKTAAGFFGSNSTATLIAAPMSATV